MTEKQQEDTIKSRIIGLLQKGYNRSQLINDFSFAERTVDSAIRDYKEQGGSEAEEPKKGEDFDPKGLTLPAKLDIKQVIVPEYLIKHLSFVDNGHRQTFVDALLVYEAARRSVMEDIIIIQGLASAQAQITDTQLKVLREAKSDSKEVARVAAEEAAWRVGQQVQEVARQAAKPESPNPMAAMFSQTIQPYFSHALAQMFGMFGGMGIPGGVMPPVAGQAAQTAPGGGQQSMVSPGTRQISDEEMEDIFNE
ncbi:MAG: hypothetical protein HYX81_03995 [Chloroflexi bacterium]|nr:hypothetical protein [Chloroflexota bacterium]